jgi:hypothetical protein
MRKVIRKFAYRVRDFLLAPLLQEGPTIRYSDAVSQLQLKFYYRALAESGSTLPSISEVGFKAFSQSDEDGILLYIFSIIGTANKKSVEICAGNGLECNTANLIINHGWSGLLVDGNANLVKQGQDFYSKNPHTYVFPPKFIHAWVTRDNVNDLIEKNGFGGEIDLLSLDLDGVDYWIWETINVIEPRVLVFEYNDTIGPERALTVPYKEDFNSYENLVDITTRNFFGASLPAFVKSAKQRGYRFVGCNRYGYNAFFIKNPLGEKEIPEASVAESFKHPRAIWGMQERFPTVKDFPWVEV